MCIFEPQEPTKNRSEMELTPLVPDVIQTSKTDILYSKMMNYEVIKSNLPSAPTCCYWNKTNRKFYYGNHKGEVFIINLLKNSQTSISRGNYDRKKIKGIYCSDDDKMWFCDVDRLYYMYGSKEKCFNLERIEKIYNYLDTTQLLAYEESGNYLYYLSDACNFICITLDLVSSNNVREYAKNITSISPKPIMIFSNILENDHEKITKSTLNKLFDRKVKIMKISKKFENFNFFSRAQSDSILAFFGLWRLNWVLRGLDTRLLPQILSFC